MRTWIRYGAAMLLGAALLVALLGCGHNPNHDIDLVRARAAADRVHPPPTPAERAKMKPGFGG